MIYLAVVLGFVVGFAVHYLWQGKQVFHNVEDLVLREAERLVTDVERNFVDMSGEFKRSQVFRALLNIFPTHDPKDLALAIELAVRK